MKRLSLCTIITFMLFEVFTPQTAFSFEPYHYYQGGYGASGPPKQGQLAYFRPSQDSIELSTTYYGQVETYWQGVFYSDPTTPLQVAVATLLADENINTTTVFASSRGTSVHADGTPQTILDRVARWHGIILVEPLLFGEDNIYFGTDRIVF